MTIFSRTEAPARVITPAALEERTLIERSRNGDVAAFDRLVRRYERNVYNTAYRLSGSYDDASDIAQEAFVRAWNNLKNFRGDSAFSTWIYRIVTNTFLDDRKRKKARPHRSLEEIVSPNGEGPMELQIEDPAPLPQMQLENDEQREILQRAILTLPEAQRIMITLYHNDNKSYEEIAEIMELPMGTVKSRLNRARLALREKLTPFAELFER